MSLSSCVYGMGEQMYEYGYNVIGFDQVNTYLYFDMTFSYHIQKIFLNLKIET